MKPELPLSRVLPASDIPPGGRTVRIEASAEERKAVAKTLGLPAIASLTANFTAKPSGRDRIAVTGRVRADVTQLCVISAEPLEAHVEEEVELSFSPDGVAFDDMSPDIADDAPDLMENEQIDLGVVAVEFLSLGLEPYPRKPGAVFAPEPIADETRNPFSVLRDLKQ